MRDAVNKDKPRRELVFRQSELPEQWRDSFLIQYNSDTVFPRVNKMGYRAIRTQRWKHIRYRKLEGMDELYDLLQVDFWQDIDTVFSDGDLFDEMQ